MESIKPGPCEYWWSVVLSALEARANDGIEPEPEEVEQAAISLIAATMLGVGIEPDEVMHCLSETALVVYMSYDPESKRVLVSVDWGDDFFDVTADVEDLG